MNEDLKLVDLHIVDIYLPEWAKERLEKHCLIDLNELNKKLPLVKELKAKITKKNKELKELKQEIQDLKNKLGGKNEN